MKIATTIIFAVMIKKQGYLQNWKTILGLAALENNLMFFLFYLIDIFIYLLLLVVEVHACDFLMCMLQK